MSHNPPIQIVNERDEPIGGMPITKSYEQGLIHRVVYVIVEDEHRNILVQKRSPYMVSQPNCWDISAAGHVDFGEEYLDAAIRETHEELGLKNQNLIEIGSFFKQGPINNKIQKRFVKVYKVSIAQETPINFDKGEVTEVKWMSIEEIRKLIKEQPNKAGIGLMDCIEKYY
jgi:isopentenyldiphosphate isomerase